VVLLRLSTVFLSWFQAVYSYPEAYSGTVVSGGEASLDHADIGATIFGCGFILHTNAMGAYILDSFEKYAASATVASEVLRMIAGFAFPIFAPAMYNRLGFGWGNRTLALIALVFGLLAPLIL
jgi:hypothetical protein